MTEQTGQCLCGAIKFKAVPVERHMDACHCRMCRRCIGGPLFSVNCQEPVLVQGEAELGVYASSEWAERCFCKRCGSFLFWRMRDKSFCSISAGAFDDLSGMKFTKEIFIDEKPDYYDFQQDTQKLTGAQVIEMFAGGQENS